MEPTPNLLRATAQQHAINRGIVPTGGPIFREVAEAYETGYAAGFIARPQAVCFPLAGKRDFLRLLAPYLPEGITVYHPRTGRYGLLRGLPATYEGQGEPLADVEFYCDAEAREEACGDITEPVSKILPVLYSFEDLATELLLPDGRRVVPAVELAQLNGGHDNIDGAAISKGINDIKLLSLTASGKHLWHEWPHNFYNGDVGYDLPKIEWLRRAHFAIGLRPNQYHRRVVGVDYANGGKPQNKISCPTCVCDGPGCAGKEVARA